jgi:hypothetical protein
MLPSRSTEEAPGVAASVERKCPPPPAMESTKRQCEECCVTKFWTRSCRLWREKSLSVAVVDADADVVVVDVVDVMVRMRVLG